MTTRPTTNTTGSELISLSVLWPYWPLVALSVVVFVGLGAAFASSSPSAYAASAGLVVQDPRASILGAEQTDPERYLIDQITVLQSSVVAERASRIASTLDPPADIEPADLLANTSVAFRSETDFITVSFGADDPVAAQIGTNAIVLAYEQITQESSTAAAAKAITALNGAIQETMAEVERLQTEIASLRATDDAPSELDSLVAEILFELTSMREQADQIQPDDLVAIENATARAQKLSGELQARVLVADAEGRSPEIAVRLQQQQDALARVNDLIQTRSRLEVNTELAGSGVAFFAPAGLGTPRGVSTTSAVVLSSLLGAVVGLGGAYWLSQSRRRFENRLEPEATVGAPLLTDISGVALSPGPGLGALLLGRSVAVDQLAAAMPVVHDEASQTAEAFRMLVGALQHRLADAFPAGLAGGGRGAVVAVVSPTVSEGRTVVAVNTALAAARAGMRVLLVDVDQGDDDASQVSTRLSADVPKIGVTLDLLMASATSTDFKELADSYDLVLLDVPPLLQTAYASQATQKADRALVVVRHRSRVDSLRDLSYRLKLLGVPAIGYAYLTSGPRREGPVGQPPPVGTATHTG